MAIILGIDPGSTTVWYAIMEKAKTPNLVDYGVIHTTPKLDIPLKLLEIGTDMKELIDKYRPDAIVVEKIFFAKNLKTWIDVSQCRGVIIYEAMRAWVTVLEFTPLEVKKAITWNGQANKKQMQLAIKMLLRLEQIPKPDDAADAIGMAYMGILQYRTKSIT